jgi:hypothetical protein
MNWEKAWTTSLPPYIAIPDLESPTVTLPSGASEHAPLVSDFVHLRPSPVRKFPRVAKAVREGLSRRTQDVPLGY